MLTSVKRRRADARAAGTSLPDAQAAVLDCRDLRKEFAGGDVVALARTSFSVRRGEVVSLLGPSGCGKTTLLRILAGLTAPSDGAARVNGLTPAEARRAKSYGMVFQQANLFDWRTVRENVELPLELLGVGRRERRAIAAEALERVGLAPFAARRPWELSGGMQQRVAIARALSFRPALLFMDEPFGALDEMTREQMNLELLRIAGDAGATVVFVTHSIAEAVFLSGRVLVMTARPGRIVRDVTIDLPYPRTPQTRELPRFFELANEVRETLRGGSAPRNEVETL
ncbi:ABC transporter ATP-binding protein [Conexibacter sp. CPCC 206217]|uniref:ABC transporter ATP-binding protein n=1 Tax=Conexibacter sp. CPCC 206217 TaxID=3064574 RepID=UPI00272918EF|nr:ABC transporter ATP-binding protein [Conexibacter sp. CPCC 206217]MDO8210165.1 ABC transporter ATP-binding protein [Conexibacter sp. CPCC 206217]